MKNKSYAVIGLGQFGMTVALTLAEANCDVLAIDDKDDNVGRILQRKFHMLSKQMYVIRVFWSHLAYRMQMLQSLR
mgnify:CR=1 FL=1